MNQSPSILHFHLHPSLSHFGSPSPDAAPAGPVIFLLKAHQWLPISLGIKLAHLDYILYRGRLRWLLATSLHLLPSGLQMCPACAARILCPHCLFCLILGWLARPGSGIFSDRASQHPCPLLLSRLIPEIPSALPAASSFASVCLLLSLLPWRSSLRTGISVCFVLSYTYLQNLKQCLVSDGAQQVCSLMD